MAIIVFLLQTVFISFSGVMAPGPITAVTISKSSKNQHAGALISLGHGIVEFPLIFLIFLGFDSLINKLYIRESIGIAGGIFLLWMGIDILRGLKTEEPKNKMEKRSPIAAGIFLSLGNPYFIVWWATIGAALIARSAEFGFFWFTVFAFVHWTCDFLWLSFLSQISYRGGVFFGKKLQKVIFVICGVFLLFLGGKFIFGALNSLF